MSNIYEVFNTKSEYDFSQFLNKLDLTTNELLSLFNIAESFDATIKEKQQQILELMAGTKQKNYKICVEQFKPKFQRVLKENDMEKMQPLNLNQVMELNNLMELVSSKLKNPNCMKGIFNIIKSKSSAKVANAFLAMAQQTQINDSNLKFNTELQIDGKNFAQIIYPIKNDIEMFANSLECPKDNKEKDEQENLKESSDISFNIISELNSKIESSNDRNILNLIITKINNMIKSFKETSIQNTLLSLKTKANTKLAELSNSSPKIEENINQDIVSAACGENTFDNLLNNLTPTFISITVNKNDGEINDDTEQAKNALKALASHINCQKDSCEENNMEELQTINSLLLKLQNYFSKTLTEDTVYDHSWYENESGKFPKRTKDGVIGLPIKEGIKDWFKKDDRKYRISYGINSGWVSKDTNYIVGDITDTITINGYKNAQKFANKLNKKYHSNMFKPQEISNNSSSNNFIHSIEFMDIIDKLRNGEISKQEASDYLSSKGVSNDDIWFYTNINQPEKLPENCSAGATCAANVSGFAKPLGSKPKKKKKISEDIQMFKEYIEQDIPSSLEINGKFISYKIIEGQNYLYIDNAILGTTNKQQILESIDDIYNDCLTIPVYEDFNHIELNLILEDNMENQPNLDNSGEPADAQKEKDIETQFNSNNKLKVSINQNNNTVANQDLVGIDDSDKNNKLYITKDPTTGKIKVVNSNDIDIQGQIQ